MFNRGKLHPIRDAWIEIAGCWRRREYPSRIPYGIRVLRWSAFELPFFDLSLTSHDICRFGQLICEYSTIRLEWPVAFRSASLLAGSFAQT